MLADNNHYAISFSSNFYFLQSINSLFYLCKKQDKIEQILQKMRHNNKSKSDTLKIYIKAVATVITELDLKDL